MKTGFNLEDHEFWKNKPDSLPPINTEGAVVENSSYQRAAWLKAGLILLYENPMGYGIQNGAFGSLASIKWNDFTPPGGYFRGATENGWLDLALSVGIIGLLLILIPLFYAWHGCFAQSRLWFLYGRFAIPSLLVAYFICEANAEHFIEILFFMISFFFGLTLKKIT
jgi:O-antigen ligase